MSTRHAVVFDDDDFFLSIMVKLFLALDVKVTALSDPGCYICSQPGITTCPVASPCTDFLLTDHRNPQGMDGIDFLKRSHRLGCKIPRHRRAIISSDWKAEDRTEAELYAGQVFEKFQAKEKLSAWITTALFAC